MRLMISAAMTGLMTAPALAGSAVIAIDIPRLNVAEYHKPYVAFWIESKDGSQITNLAVWYDVKLKNDEGTKWLKDMRQWWRRTGRELTMPSDGLSSPTRPPGTHKLTFDAGKTPLSKLGSGEYVLVVEAAREVGGRELLKIPFQWPPKAPTSAEAKGEHEIGNVTLTLTP
ncbi:MAG TPA: DUF2271 domain-containing protein [Xanthobacteraceae bacterium]|nr:DUF2271 domain-containing protein [Xanthobacteraceae bacterium]